MPDKVEYEYACYNCGQYWSVDDTYDSPEPADACPACDRKGHLVGTYRVDELEDKVQ